MSGFIISGSRSCNVSRFHVILNVIAIVIAELIAADIVFCGGFLTFVWYDILKV